MWNDDDAHARALRVWFAQPSPPARTLADLDPTANAVLIDLAGNLRDYTLPTPYAEVVLVPVSRPLTVARAEVDATLHPLAWAVRVFRLSSVIDGKAVYRQRA